MCPRFDGDVQSQPPEESGRRRGRPRDPGLETRVLDAAVEEYAERGWAGLTMDGVARRAGVGKSTLYLRWPDKGTLLAAAVEAIATPLAPPDTGSLRGDLELLARQLRRWYADPRGWAVTRIWIDAASSGHQVGHFVDVVNHHYRPAALSLFERAVERGEARKGIPAQLAVNEIYGAMFMCATMRRWDEPQAVEPDEDELLQQVVDFWLRGIAPWLVSGAADPGTA